MKKWIIACSLACCSFAYADAAIVRNVIINAAPHTINYELSTSFGTVYAGALTPGQTKIIYLNDLPEKLYGTYSLFTEECYTYWLNWTCKAKTKTVFIKQNEDVLWENSRKEIKITETILPGR